MSLKNIKLGSAIISAGLFVGLGISYFGEMKSRNLASVSADEKPFPAPKLDLWGHSPYGKINQSMEVKIEAIDGIPENDEQELKLIAQVTLNRNVDQELSYRWILPAGVSVVSGEVEDSWPGIQAGQTAQAEISLIGMSREGLAKTVTLQVFATSTDNGQSIKYANSGSFTTDPRSFEVIDEELALQKKSEVGKIKE